MPNETGARLLGVHGPELVPDSAPEQEESAAKPVATAFLVIVGLDGKTYLSKNIDTPIVPAREATDDEVIGATHTIGQKLAVQMTANLAGQQVMAGVQAAAQIQQEMRLRDAIAQNQIPVPGQPR